MFGHFFAMKARVSLGKQLGVEKKFDPTMCRNVVGKEPS